MTLRVPVAPFPLQISNGDFVLVEQNSDYEIEGCVEAIARCPQGYLDSLPEMGLPDWTLTRGTPDLTEIRASIAPYEPRASLVVDARLSGMVADITIDREQADRG